ncbi:hypothetical protein llap_202 [Limosa lapponica baueri]|uniref:Uncharacterized protein n=1 Tax=Limosa lapponica baueri TaxID=1758121 RepID=A0A2I0UTV7_LIMLA|nr:hypothetical protein llap_202 [Limosa lapponica baueri]
MEGDYLGIAKDQTAAVEKDEQQVEYISIKWSLGVTGLQQELVEEPGDFDAEMVAYVKRMENEWEVIVLKRLFTGIPDVCNGCEPATKKTLPFKYT